MKRSHSQRVAHYSNYDKLGARIASYELTMKNQRGKYSSGFKRPGSTNNHKQG